MLAVPTANGGQPGRPLPAGNGQVTGARRGRSNEHARSLTSVLLSAVLGSIPARAAAAATPSRSRTAPPPARWSAPTRPRHTTRRSRHEQFRRPSGGVRDAAVGERHSDSSERHGPRSRTARRSAPRRSSARPTPLRPWVWPRRWGGHEPDRVGDHQSRDGTPHLHRDAVGFPPGAPRPVPAGPPTSTDRGHEVGTPAS